MGIEEIIILFIVGCIGGYLSGLLGIGGGIVYVVVFDIVLSRLPFVNGNEKLIVQMTLINSIFAIFFAALSGCIKQYKIGNFYYREVLLAAIPGTVAAVGFTHFVNQWEGYDKDTFLTIFSLALLPLFIRFVQKKNTTEEQQQISPAWFSVAGALAGTCTAFTGLGGGIVMNPFLHGALRYPLKKTLSIALGNMLITTFFISIYHLSISPAQDFEVPGYFSGIYLPLLVPVTIGNLIFSPIGVAAAQKMSPNIIKWIFIIFSALILGRNFYQIFMV